MRVLLIGANGNTGFRLTRILAGGAHDVVAMIRSSEQEAKFKDLEVPTVQGDLEYPIDHALAGCDAVVFAAGSGPNTGKDKTVLVDHIGAIRAAVTAQVQGCRRFIMLSAMNVDVNSDSKISHFHKAKAHADNFLRETDLDWTVVCPGGLHDDPVETAKVLNETFGSVKTSRDLLAKTLAACLDEPNTIHKTFGLADGEQDLGKALGGLA